MTYSIIARCNQTGAFGAAIATSNLAVGGRCVRLAHGKGAFLSQHRTDPRLGDVGIAALQLGANAATAVADAVAVGGDGIGWRQLGALDAEGHSAVHHGDLIYSIYADARTEHALALGNILAAPEVVTAMAAAFAATDGQRLAARLLAALEAGRDTGGEVGGPVRSAALRVTGEDGLDACDLRVDMADEAVSALASVVAAHAPTEALSRRNALTPREVPVDRKLFEGSVRRIADLGLEAEFPTAANAKRWKVGS